MCSFYNVKDISGYGYIQDRDRFVDCLRGYPNNPNGWKTAVLRGGEKDTDIYSFFDVIIRTQAEFEALYNSSDWLGAKSVAFIGNGGVLQFTRYTTGLKIPSTVKRIVGFNSAKITINNLIYNYDTNRAGLWYASLPTTSEYSIENLTVKCTADSSGIFDGIGFCNCTRLLNCTGNGIATRDSGSGYGFSGCTELLNYIGNSTTTTGMSGGFFNCVHLTNCTAKSVTNGNSARAFYSCTQITNCTATGGNQGFENCKQLANCIASGVGSGFSRCSQLANCTGTGSSGAGFNMCTHLTNCIGSGIGNETIGYAFYICDYANGCKEGETLSAKGIWGGTNTFRDDSSCQLTR